MYLKNNVSALSRDKKVNRVQGMKIVFPGLLEHINGKVIMIDTIMMDVFSPYGQNLQNKTLD